MGTNRRPPNAYALLHALSCVLGIVAAWAGMHVIVESGQKTLNTEAICYIAATAVFTLIAEWTRRKL